MTQNGFAALDGGGYALSGRLTFETVPQFFSHTASLLGGAADTVTIDLAGVTLADSAGIALLVEWQQRARAARRTLTFANMPEQVRKIIHVSGLQRAFDIS